MKRITWQKHEKRVQSDNETYRVEAVYWETQYGENKFNVDVFIYPKHPLFRKCKEDMFAVPSKMPLHGGSTFCKWHRTKTGKIESKQYGSDYQHLGDDYMQYKNSLEDAPNVLHDAKLLVDYMELTKEER